MSNVVDINKSPEAETKKKRIKKPTKAQWKTVGAMAYASGISSILKAEGDGGANGRTGEVALAWWRKSGLAASLTICKHGHAELWVNMETVREPIVHQLVGYCVMNGIEWDAY